METESASLQNAARPWRTKLYPDCLLKPLSTTTVTSSIVIDVSAMFVA